MSPTEHIAKIIANELNHPQAWEQYIPAALEITAEYMITTPVDWRIHCATGEELG